MSVSAEAPPAQELPRRSLFGQLAVAQRDYPIVQVVTLGVVFVYGAATIEGFTSPFSMRSMLILASLLGISAIGQTVCLLIGGLDVSIPGWVLAGATVTVELLGGQGKHWSIAEVFVFLGVGAVIFGGLTGLICYRYRVPPLVVTLGTGAMLQGAVLVWKGGNITGVPPGWLARMTSASGRTFGLGIPTIVFVWAALAVIVYVVLQRTVVGAWVYATGNNLRAAQLALVPTAWVWVGAFALSALSATTAGVLLAGFSGGGDQSVGQPYLWNGLTAVLVGGTAFGARGDYNRTVIGALLVTVLAQVMTGHGLQPSDQNILYGALIIVVVGIYRRERRLRDQV
ncbi:MAG TPA: ABC transporter permease [Gaiellaceae bacterium]|nr:ABC transporter permease [Gaiellaceae bacterium]